jgi:hypothetical protein
MPRVELFATTEELRWLESPEAEPLTDLRRKESKSKRLSHVVPYNFVLRCIFRVLRFFCGITAGLQIGQGTGAVAG